MYFVDLKVTLGPSSTNRHQGQAHYGIKRDKMTYVGGITDGFACGGGHTIANRISYNVALDSWSRMCMIDSFHQVNDLFAPPHPAFCVPSTFRSTASTTSHRVLVTVYSQHHSAFYLVPPYAPPRVRSRECCLLPLPPPSKRILNAFVNVASLPPFPQNAQNAHARLPYVSHTGSLGHNPHIGRKDETEHGSIPAPPQHRDNV